MEPLILLGREVLARRTPWRLAVVAGTTVRPEEHGFPELKGVTLTDHSSAQEPDGPTVATYADPSVRLTEENLVFALPPELRKAKKAHSASH